MNAATVVNRMYQLLDAANAANLGGWVDADLYGYLNDSLRRICLDAAIIGADTSQSVTSPNFTATLPAATLAVLDAAWNGNGLEIVDIRDLDNTNAAWSSQYDYPTRIAFDQQGIRVARLNQNPTATGTLRLVATQYPATLDSSTSLACPNIVDVIVLMESIASARRQEGLYQQADTATSLQGVADILKDSIKSMYGRSM